MSLRGEVVSRTMHGDGQRWPRAGLVGLALLASLLLMACGGIEPADEQPPAAGPPSAGPPATAERTAAGELTVVVRQSAPAPEAGPPGLPPERLAAPVGEWVAEARRAGTGLESTRWEIRITGPGAPSEPIAAEAVNLSGLVWSPDGSKLAYCEGAILRVVDRDGSTRTTLESGPGGPYPGACFDLVWDGDRLSFTRVATAERPELAAPERVTLVLGKESRPAP